MSLTARPFQLVGEKFLASRRGAILADEMGLGKTMQSILAARHFERPVLVISRPLNKYFWAYEIRRWDPDPYVPIRMAVEAGYHDEVEVQSWFDQARRGYLIIHHEALRYVAYKLRKYGIWEVIIADEAHRFKNRKAQMSKSLKIIPAFHKWALSGTMQERSVADMWSVLNWFEPDLFSSYWKFFEAFVDYENSWGGGRDVKGSKDLDVMGKLVGPYFLRRSRVQLGMEAPVEPEDVPVPMSDAQQTVYKELKTKTFADIQHDSGALMFIPNMLARISRLQRAALDPALIGSSVRGTKTQWIYEWQQDHDKPFVIFTQSRVYADNFPVLVPGGKTISGSVPQRERDKILQDFDAGKIRYIIGTIDTMSESVNLQHAQVAVFTDLHWSSIQMHQAMMRVQRPLVSDLPVQIIQLLSPDTVDYYIKHVLEHKMTERELVQMFIEKHGSNDTNEI